MGYTHYWNFKSAHGKSEETEKQYQLAIRQCQRIVRFYQDKVKSIDKKHGGRLSGYTAHCKIGQYGGIDINGVQELAHENFYLREHFSQNGSEFCKTAQKPYDVVVVACLITLKYYLGGLIAVDSDGDRLDWSDGLLLAIEALRIKELDIPKSIESHEPRLEVAQ